MDEDQRGKGGSQEQPRDFVQRSAACIKDYPSGRHPETYNCKSHEISVVDYTAVYCSTEQPTIGQRGDSGWSVSYLSFDDENDYHSIHWSNRLYFLVCHHFDIGEQSNIVGFDRIARRFGYYPIDLTKVPGDVKVQEIEGVASLRAR